MVVTALVVGCGGGGEGGVPFPSGEAEQQPPLDSEQPGIVSDAPALDEHAPTVNPFSPAVPCEPASDVQVLAIASDVVCAKARECGQPTSPQAWMRGDEFLDISTAIWGYNCVLLTLCQQEPAMCEGHGLLPVPPTGLCAEEVFACYTALFELRACSPLEAQAAFEPPPECANITWPTES